MSQDKPVLSQSDIELMCEAAIGVSNRWSRANAESLHDLALSALERQGSGKWVPLEPTKDMVLAGQDEHDGMYPLTTSTSQTDTLDYLGKVTS